MTGRMGALNFGYLDSKNNPMAPCRIRNRAMIVGKFKSKSTKKGTHAREQIIINE